MKKIILAVAVAAVATMALVGSASAGPPGITATPAASKTWANHTATFVRSTSGIINETDRVNLDPAGPQNPWTSADVYLQFRPTTGPSGSGSPTANPACDPNGLVLPAFIYVNDPVAYPAITGTATSGYFINSNPYNVCVYLVNPQVASGTIESAVLEGTTATLPTGLAGKFRIDVSGTYTNSTLNIADAEYTNSSLDSSWATHQQGYNVDPWFLGEDFGDVQVNGNFVNWGDFAASHAYSLSTTLSGSVNLAVFDGDSTGKRFDWYGDNSGSLTYTITYLGL